MSLRYKALAAVLLLVTAVTGSVLWFVKQRVESNTAEDIRNDLAVDGLRLKEKLHSEADTARAAIGPTIQEMHLEKYKGMDGGIKQNLDADVLGWVKQSHADFAVAALDRIFAEDGKAKALHKEKDWWIVACGTGKPEPDPVLEARIASTPSVNDLVGRTIARIRTVTEVIVVGDELCLAVAVPLFGESTTSQKFFAAEENLERRPGPKAAEEMKDFQENWPVYGCAMTLTVLSDSWTLRNRLRKPESATVERTKAEEARLSNVIYQVLYTGTRATSTSLPQSGVALEALNAARAGGAERFSVPLEISGRRETYIGLALSFDDRAFSWDRPGFLAMKAIDPELGPLHDLLVAMTSFGAIFAILGAALAYGAAWLVIRRLRTLQVATEKVRAGDFQVTVPVDSRDEVGTLAVAFNNMIKGLQALGLYTDSVLARSVLDNPELLGNKAARHEGTVMFTDIRNFTGITESMDASALTAQLNEYFSAIGEHVKKEGGYLDKFIGDAVMAFWGAPFLSTQDHAARACRAAMHCMRAASELRRQWEKEGKPLFFQRIGVATGEVVVGNIGSATKKNFTVIGDSVNLANRLEGASKVYGTEILLDERTVELAGNAILVREIDEIVVRGKQQPVRVFELVGLAAETSTRAKRLMDGYGAALKRYRAGDFESAKATLVELRKSDPEDGPSKWLLGRCEEVLSGKSVPTPLQITKSYGPLKP
ncbi:MAG: adenylate/guanylate cyclase domain-containing protein [Planctomycetota bacterium]